VFGVIQGVEFEELFTFDERQDCLVEAGMSANKAGDVSGFRATWVPRQAACARAEESSPSRWRFRPPNPLTFRFRVEPSG
jgi:hypothetical protein